MCVEGSKNATGSATDDERSVLIADMKAEGLPDFEALGAARDLGTVALGCPLAETVAVPRPPRPVHPAEMDEALGRTLLEVLQERVQDVLAPAAVEIDYSFNMGGV